MTRDETIALFLECEAKRAEARAAALAEGKVEYDAENIAHGAAKSHWNAWAEGLLAERTAMEADGRWASVETDWTARATADFKFCLFLNKGTVDEEKEANAKAALEKRATEAEDTVKSIAVDSGATRFDRFIFPGDASFASATFTGNASFASATFTGNAWFDSATFTGDASFRGRTFPKDVFFIKARFGPGRADFGLATFERVVQFDGAVFTGEADFNAVAGKRTFSMSGAKFEGVPNFIQAHFEEAPRLDNVSVTPTKNSELLTADQALDCSRAGGR